MLPDVAFALLHANGELAGTEATPNALLDDGFARSLLSLSRSQALALRATLSAFDIGVARKLSTIEFSELLAAHGVVPAHARPGFWRYVSAAFGTLALVISTKRDQGLGGCASPGRCSPRRRRESPQASRRRSSTASRLPLS